MSRNKKTTLYIIILLGFITPYFPYFTIIEAFYLLIPFVILFVVTFIYLIFSLINEQLNSRKALFVFSILPIFIVSQILSGFTVNKIQRLRSNQIIIEIEKLKSESGTIPEEYDLFAGIKYIKMKGSEHYIIKYTRGFMVTEKYDSESKDWRSYGWND